MNESQRPASDRPTDPVAALIPAYNEAEHITQVVGLVRRSLPVLVVDDGSIDETALLAGEVGAEVLRQVPNQGKGAALRAGFRRALELGCQAVLTLDADGQHDPADIPQFLEAFAASQADLIIGQRDFRRMPFIRRLANTTGRWLFTWALGQPIPDNQSGYRLISRRLMEALLDSQEQGFEFEVEMIATCLQRGYRLEWVPIRTIYAGEASHIQPLQHVRQFVRVVLAARRQIRENSLTNSFTEIYPNYSMVRLLTDKYIGEGVKTGDIGAIVEIYNDATNSPAYDVEFCDTDGTTIAMLVLRREEIELAEENLNP